VDILEQMGSIAVGDIFERIGDDEIGVAG